MRTPAWIALLMLSQISAGCTGERAFKQYQICLGGQDGLQQLRSELELIASNNRMKFIDQSDATLEDLKALESDLAKKPMIQMYVEGDDYGLTASNVGLGGYQVAVGFGPESGAAHSFANQVTERLQNFWQLHDLPRDEGAFPLPDCD